MIPCKNSNSEKKIQQETFRQTVAETNLVLTSLGESETRPCKQILGLTINKIYAVKLYTQGLPLMWNKGSAVRKLGQTELLAKGKRGKQNLSSRRTRVDNAEKYRMPDILKIKLF